MFRSPALVLIAAVLHVFFAAAQSPVLGVDPGAGTVSASLVVTGTVERGDSDKDTPLPSDLRMLADCHHGNFVDGGGVTQSGGFRFTMTPDPLAIASGSICALEAKAFGYDSSVARFPVRSSSGLVNVGVITVQRNAGGEAQDKKAHTSQTVSATSLKAPPDAVKLFERGSHSLQQAKYAAAAKDFEAAVKAYPEYAEAWLSLGRARLAMKSTPAAREALLRAAQLDPQMPGPPEELGLLAAEQNDLPAAAKYLDESLRLDPSGSYRACYSDAVVNMMLKRYGVAEQSARAALRFGDTGTQVRVNYVLGMALLATGNNTEAKQRLQRYLELSPNAPEREGITRELARLDQIGAAR